MFGMRSTLAAEPLQIFHREPLRIRITRIGEPFGQRCATPRFISSGRILRFDDKVRADINGMTRLIHGEEGFVELLAGANADDIDFTFRCDRSRKICDLHTWNLGDENSSASPAFSI